MRRRYFVGAAALSGLGLAAILYFSFVAPGPHGEASPADRAAHSWTAAERRTIASLSIDRLPPLEADPSNAVGDDPAAVALGHALFFDSGLSPDRAVSCATCHKPELYFTDGKIVANARGADTPRHTPSIVGIAYSDWFYWDGRKDSQWAQALAPLEAPIEHAGSRAALARYVVERYGDPYAAVFGPAPDLSDDARFPPGASPLGEAPAQAAWEGMSEEDRLMVNRVFANIGKAIASYSRRIMPGRNRFDDYAAAALEEDAGLMRALYTPQEAQGLRLFINEGQCTDCHNGPMLTNGTFQNIGLPLQEGAAFDLGRRPGALQAVQDEFNCLGAFSDADRQECVELRFIKLEGDELLGAFKAPSLRNVAHTAPYMHNGIFADLDAVIRHYNHAPPAFPGHSDLVPLAFNEEQSAALKAFLMTLSADPDAPPELLRPPADDGG